MFNGASKPTFDRLGFQQTHLGNFGTVRTQVLSAEYVDIEDIIIRNNATIENAAVQVLTVITSITLPDIIVNDGNDAVIIGITGSETAGERGVLIGSGTGLGTDTISIGQGNTITSAGNFSIILGQNSTSDEDHNIIIGTGTTGGQAYNSLVGFSTAVTVGGNNHLVGNSASAAGSRNVVLGDSARVLTGNDCVSIGYACDVENVNNAVGIGYNGDVSNNAYAAVAIGANTTVTEEQSVVIGNLASATGGKAVCIGAAADTAAVLGAVAIGAGADSNGAGSVSVGYGAISGYGVSVGGSATAANGVTVGPSSSSQSSSVAVGSATLANGVDCIALGSGVSTRIDNEMVTPGLRIIRVSVNTTNATPTDSTFFHLNNADEIVMVEGALTVRTSAGENASYKFDNYIFERTGTLLSTKIGMRSINNPLELPINADLVVTGVAGNTSMRLRVTGVLATAITWNAVLRVWCGPKV